MTDDSGRLDRRTFVQGTAALATAGVLAGCSDGGGSGGGNEDGSSVSDEQKQRVDDYLSDDETYDEIQDQTGMDEVVVDVGAEGNGGPYAFDPSAIAVSANTTVSWQWTGNGNHNVVSSGDSDFDFDSGEPKMSGDPFEQSFDDTGVGLYVCEPHEGLGMKGAVVVVDEE